MEKFNKEALKRQFLVLVLKQSLWRTSTDVTFGNTKLGLQSKIKHITFDRRTVSSDNLQKRGHLYPACCSCQDVFQLGKFRKFIAFEMSPEHRAEGEWKENKGGQRSNRRNATGDARHDFTAANNLRRALGKRENCLDRLGCRGGCTGRLGRGISKKSNDEASVLHLTILKRLANHP